MILVKAANPERVALWERHPDHPGGEIFISGETAVSVAETQAVQARLKSGVLVLCEEPEPAAPRRKRGHSVK